MRFDSSDAAHLDFDFTRFFLPPSATLHFVSMDGQFTVGPFGAERNNADRVFFSPIVLGQDSLVVLTVGGAEKAAVEPHLTQVNHGYRGFGVKSKACKSGSCNTDVACLRATRGISRGARSVRSPAAAWTTAPARSSTTPAAIAISCSPAPPTAA